MGLKVHNTGFLAVSPSFRNGGIALIVTGIVIACIAFLYRLIQDKLLIKEVETLYKKLADIIEESLKKEDKSEDLLKENRLKELLKTVNPMMKGDRDYLKKIRSYFIAYLLALSDNGDINDNNLDFIISQVKFFDEKLTLSFLMVWSQCVNDDPHEPLPWEKALLLVAQNFLSKVTEEQVEDEMTAWDVFQEEEQPRHLLLISHLMPIINDAEQPSGCAKNWPTIKTDIIFYCEQIIFKLQRPINRAELDARIKSISSKSSK